MDFLSDEVTIRFDSGTRDIGVFAKGQRLVQIRPESYGPMSFEELSEFIGARVLLLMPSMREQYREHISLSANSDVGTGFTKRR